MIRIGVLPENLEAALFLRAQFPKLASNSKSFLSGKETSAQLVTWVLH